MRINYHINRSIAKKVDSTYLGYRMTNNTQRLCLVASGGRELVTFRSLVRRFPATNVDML